MVGVEGGGVKLKAVTEIRQSIVCDTFIADLVLNSLLDWEHVEGLKLT